MCAVQRKGIKPWACFGELGGNTCCLGNMAYFRQRELIINCMGAITGSNWSEVTSERAYKSAMWWCCCADITTAVLG